MKYRIEENEEGFEVQGYFEPRKQTWIGKFINGTFPSGWQTLDINGRLWGISIDHVLGMDFTEKKAVFETFEEAQRFIKRINTEKKVVYATE